MDDTPKRIALPMSDQASKLIARNFILKRVDDQLYLPCEKIICCKAPPFISNLPYILCRSRSFDVSTGLLLLDAPTSYERWGEKSYQVSAEMNSALILASGVKTFQILWGSTRVVDFPPKYEWPDHPAGESFTPFMTDDDDLTTESPVVKSKAESPTPFSFNEKCRIAIKALDFGDGKLSFTRFVHPRVGQITFDIPVEISRKEFNAVKEYFEKVLRSKTVECEIIVEVDTRGIISATARFCQDNLFSRDLIEEVDEHVIRSQILNNEDDISLLEDKLKELIGLEEEERTIEGLLDRMAKLKKSKHYYHLRHLSSLHVADLFRLRITGSPLSFIFVIKGQLDYHLVWETYETEEATYIWKLTAADDQVRQLQLNELLDKIKWLRKSNKSAYIRSKPTEFTRIEHNYFVDEIGLQQWKSELDRILT